MLAKRHLTLQPLINHVVRSPKHTKKLSPVTVARSEKFVHYETTNEF